MPVEGRIREISLLPGPAPSDALHQAMEAEPSMVRAAPSPAWPTPEPPPARPVALDPPGGLDALLAPAKAGEAASIDPEKAAPVPVASFLAGVIAGCLERVAMLARHRSERPLAARPRAEGRLLAQIDALAQAGASPADLASFWAGEGEEDPWITWAVVFALASFDGAEPLAAIADLVEALPDDDPSPGSLAAEALLVAPHPHVALLARDLARSDSPAARAAAIEVRSRQGGVDGPAALEALADAHPLPAMAALRALARTELPYVPSALRAALRHPDARVAREASRTVAVLGHRDAYLEARADASLAAKLGPAAVELLVGAGDLADLPVLQSIVRRAPASAEQLDAVARFGHPATWAYLAHYLDHDTLGEPAQRALFTLFGPLVPDARELRPASLRDALSRAEIAPDVRLRRGRPWSLEAVAAECARDDLTRRDLDLRLDELRAHGVAAGLDTALWGRPAASSLASLVARPFPARAPR